ncbi:MAG: iron-sulfur cluster assembly scaffold protein [Candidatus Komeilibacteria bacterium]|nr:iron-sulfur cluster assembly scaffold protein [Candidatus Komeilibacteria bacterium]
MGYYNETVMDYFQHPRNQEKLVDADAIGDVGNPVCSSLIKVYIKVKDNILEQVTFEAFGSPATIASAGKLTELAQGQTLEQGLAITNQDIADSLGGVPEEKMTCAVLSADALHAAIKQYQDKFVK